MTGPLDRAIAGTILLWGWRRMLVALLAGAASAAALAPLHVLPVLALTLPILVWLIDGTAGADAGGRRLSGASAAFLVGWSFGLGYFLAGLYWVGFAVFVDVEQFAWALPITVIVLPAGLAVFTGLSTLLAWAFWGPGYRRVVLLAATWCAGEMLRGVLFSGFPWNLLGQAFASSDALRQPAAYVGDIGLGIVAILIAGAPALLVDIGPERGPARRALPLVLAAAALAALYAGGTWRLAAAPHGSVPGVALRIVQPNIDQSRKWSPELRSETVALYLELSDRATSPDHPGIAAVTHLIWPETALPLLLENDPQVMAQVAALLPDEAFLITGALRTEPPHGGPDARYFNSVFVIAGDGTLAATYDKRRLVPFGEFLPAQSWLERLGLTQFTGVLGGFVAGTSRAALRAGVVPRFNALVCYEIIFSNDIIDPVQRPGWLVNVTNDGWFGDTAGPSQHFAQAQMRATEQGLSVVRAANTGISGVIDSYGRVLSKIPQGRQGVIDAQLPAPAAPTFYSNFGRLPSVAFIALVLLASAILSKRDRIRPTGDTRHKNFVFSG